MACILCVDPDPAISGVLEGALQSVGHRVIAVTGWSEGLQVLGQGGPDLVVASQELPDGTSLDLLRGMRERGIETPVIVTSPYSSVEDAVASIRHGAIDYLTKPLRSEAVRIAITNAIEIERMRRVNESYRSEIRSLRGPLAIVGTSRALREAMDVLMSVAPTRATVLLEGESGTGKELFARALHEHSSRAAGPFVSVNCAALPEGLVESTLFGHERGAFTGASSRAAGAFERANRGTLLLDEVSEMRLDLQAKLLRAIQEQEFERVGGQRAIQVDVRIVATTNRVLLAEVEAGRFRRDLYFRLNVVPVRTPPLRERLEDVPALVDHIVARVAAEMGVRPPAATPEVIDLLMGHSWPGNIRELANAIERAVILCRSGALTPVLFAAIATPAPSLSGGRVAGPVSAARAALGFEPKAGGARIAEPAGVDGRADDAPGEAPLNLAELEQITIHRALKVTGGHRLRAAKLLGISDRTLRNKIRR